MNEEHCAALTIAPGLELYHTGPNLDSGPLPTLFYFALSGPDSLCTDPYNQIVHFLRSDQIRIFSLTLPAHESELPPQDALRVWAEEMSKGQDPLGRFLDQAQQAVDYVLSQKLAEPKKIAAAGLSRGGLLASLLAAKTESIQSVLGFAPLVKLSLAKEFQNLSQDSLVASYDVARAASLLASKRLRYYIGNRDVRVSTRACFDCVEQIAEAAFKAHIRSPQVELILSPSIGHQGHGTPPEIFKQGADWIAELFKA